MPFLEVIAQGQMLQHAWHPLRLSHLPSSKPHPFEGSSVLNGMGGANKGVPGCEARTSLPPWLFWFIVASTYWHRHIADTSYQDLKIALYTQRMSGKYGKKQMPIGLGCNNLVNAVKWYIKQFQGLLSSNPKSRWIRNFLAKLGPSRWREQRVIQGHIIPLWQAWYPKQKHISKDCHHSSCDSGR